MTEKTESRRKRKVGNILTELDILESALITFEQNPNNVAEVIKCVRAFRNEIAKIMT